MLKGIIFDLDGTLLDTMVDIGRALDAAFAEFGYPPANLRTLREVVSFSRKEIVSMCLPREAPRDMPHLQALAERFSLRYGELMGDNTRPFPGVEDMLLSLQARGIPLGVYTGKGNDKAQALTAQKLPPVFRRVLGSGIYPKKPDPQGALALLEALGAAPGEALYVGDAETDLYTAQNAGIPFIAVSWGYRSPAFLKGLGAARFLEQPSDISLYL